MRYLKTGWKALCCGTCLMLSGWAQATIVLSDGAGDFGPDSAVLDTSTGLRWLRLGFTNGLSFDDVSQRFGAGEQFSGYRYATRTEIRQFWTDAGIVDLSGGRSPQNYGPVRALQALLGTNDGRGTLSYGRSADVGGPATHFTPRIQVNAFGDGIADLTCCAMFDNVRNPTGSWLVTASVPEPGEVAFVLAGMAVLSWKFARRPRRS